MENDELVFLSATELASEIKAKEISPVEVVKACLNRITAVDAKLNAGPSSGSAAFRASSGFD